MTKKFRNWKKNRISVSEAYTRHIAARCGKRNGWITMTRCCMHIKCCVWTADFWNIFRICIHISAWMKHRTHRRSSMRSLHFWQQSQRICSWSGTKTRVSMDSVQRIRRHYWILKKIIREQECF